jgi:MFS family permease
MVMVHVVAYAVSRQLTHMEAAFVLSLIGFANIFGRLPAGRLSDRLGRKTIGVVSTSVQCIVLVCLIWAKSPWMFNLFAVLFGLMWGAIGTIITALVGDIFGTSRLGRIMGATSAMWAAGAALGPALGGLLYDISENYVTAFGFGAAALLIATLLIGMIKPLPDISGDSKHS